jgi:N-acetylneuraminic acid mutarotase
MNKALALTLVLIFLTASSIIVAMPVSGDSMAENTWTTKAPMPTARTLLGVAVVNDKIYAIGGCTHRLNVTEEYNPTTNTWTTKAAMPTPRFSFAIAVYHNKIYCIGGLIANSNPMLSSSVTGAIEVYDPAADTWEVKKPMPTPRTQFEANVVNDRIYLIGGRTGGQYSTVTSNEVYDPVSESWTTKTGMFYPVTEYASTVIGSKIYVMGGQDEFNDPMTLDANQIYDTTTDSWSFGTPIPTAVKSAACVSSVTFPSKIFLIGGELATGGSGTNNTQIYNPEKDSWSVGASMPTARFGIAIATLDGAIYAIGGTEGYILPTEKANTENEMYTPTDELPSSSPNPTPTPTVPELSLLVVIPLIVGIFTIAVIPMHRKGLKR